MSVFKFLRALYGLFEAPVVAGLAGGGVKVLFEEGNDGGEDGGWVCVAG